MIKLGNVPLYGREFPVNFLPRYAKIPPGVLEELQSKNPPNEKGHRKYHHHRFLTEDIGNVHLEKQVAVVTSLIKAASNWRVFERLFARAFPPTEPEQMGLFDEQGKDI